MTLSLSLSLRRSGNNEVQHVTMSAGEPVQVITRTDGEIEIVVGNIKYLSIPNEEVVLHICRG
jgi:hypothetical protein